MRAVDFDNVRMGDDYGGIVQVFAPRWWQIGRWLAWWFRLPWQVKTSVDIRLEDQIVIEARAIRIRYPPSFN